MQFIEVATISPTFTKCDMKADKTIGNLELSRRRSSLRRNNASRITKRWKEEKQRDPTSMKKIAI